MQDHEGKQITVEELVDRYYKDPDRFFQFNDNSNNNDGSGGSPRCQSHISVHTSR